MSASYLLGIAAPDGFTSAGHHGPSVNIEAGIRTGGPLAGPSVTITGRATCRPVPPSTWKMQFSLADHLSFGLSTPRAGGRGPYVVQGPFGSVAGFNTCGGDGSPKNSTRKSTTLSTSGRSVCQPS